MPSSKIDGCEQPTRIRSSTNNLNKSQSIIGVAVQLPPPSLPVHEEILINTICIDESTDLKESDDESCFSKFSNKMLADQSKQTMNNIFALKSSVVTTGGGDSGSATQNEALNDLQEKQLHDPVSRYDIEIKKNNELDNVNSIFLIGY